MLVLPQAVIRAHDIKEEWGKTVHCFKILSDDSQHMSFQMKE